MVDLPVASSVRLVSTDPPALCIRRPTALAGPAAGLPRLLGRQGKHGVGWPQSTTCRVKNRMTKEIENYSRVLVRNSEAEREQLSSRVWRLAVTRPPPGPSACEGRRIESRTHPPLHSPPAANAHVRPTVSPRSRSSDAGRLRPLFICRPPRLLTPPPPAPYYVQTDPARQGEHPLVSLMFWYCCSRHIISNSACSNLRYFQFRTLRRDNSFT